VNGQQLDIASLHRRHPGYQTRTTWDSTEDHPPSWYARPWNGDQDRPWDGAEVVFAGSPQDLDEMLAKLEAEG
jgi:hypothetical protein